MGQIAQGRFRTNTNELVYKIANAKINTWEAREKENGLFRKTKEIIPISEFYKRRKRKAIIEIINENDNEIKKLVCVKPGPLKLQEYDFQKVGRPAYNWWEKGLRRLLGIPQARAS